MSSELWGPVDKLNGRWAMCGHTYKLAHESSDNCPSKCDVCGRKARSSFKKTAARDFVPSAELLWGSAERKNVRRHKDPKVCIYPLCVLNFETACSAMKDAGVPALRRVGQPAKQWSSTL